MKHNGVTCPRCNTTFDRWKGLYRFFKCPFCQGLIANSQYGFMKAVADGRIRGKRWDEKNKQVRSV